MLPAPVGLSYYLGDESSPGLADGAGVNARFNEPSAVSADAVGHVYVADQKRTVVRRITAQGVVSTLPVGCYQSVRDVAVGTDGNIYVLDIGFGRGRLCRQTPAGDVTEVHFQQLGALGTYATLAIGPGGELYVATRKAVYRISSDGTAALLADSESEVGLANGTGAAATFTDIGGIATDAAGNIYVAESSYGIRKVTPQGVVTTFGLDSEVPVGSALERVVVIGDGVVTFPAIDLRIGLLVQDDGSVVYPRREALYPFAGSLRRMTTSGLLSTVPGSEGLYTSTPALARGAAGSIIYTDKGGVGRLLANGTTASLAGRGLVGPDHATVEAPMAVDTGGNLITSAPTPGVFRGTTLRKRDTSGRLVAFAPGRDIVSLAPAEANVPLAPVAVGGDGSIYASYSRQAITPGTGIAETEIYKVSPSGETTRILFAHPGDANFIVPAALAPGPGGTLYVIDAMTNSVRRLNADGTVSIITPDNELRPDGGAPLTQIGVSAAGKVYVLSEFGDARLFTVNDAGRLQFVAGRIQRGPTLVDGTGANASFLMAGPPVFDEQGNLYVIDSSTLRRITPDGVVTTVAGTPGSKATRLGPLPGTLQPYVSLMARSPDGVFYVRAGDAIVRIRLNTP